MPVQPENENSSRPLTLAEVLAAELRHVRPRRDLLAEAEIQRAERVGGDLAANWRANLRKIVAAVEDTFRPLWVFVRSIFLTIKNRVSSFLFGDPPAAEVAPPAEDLGSVFQRLYDSDLSAICLSGGGIRSATFALGVIEALAERRLLSKFDFLSTVSGGGYLGSWLSAWIRREQIETMSAKLRRLKKDGDPDGEVAAEEIKVYEAYQQFRSDGVSSVEAQLNRKRPLPGDASDPAIEPKQFQFLREYSNYMTPRVGLLSADTWTFIAIYLRNVFLNWTIFIPLISAVLLAPWILVAITLHDSPTGWGLDILLGAAAAAGLVVALVVIVSLPSGATDVSKPAWSTDGGVVMRGILPLLFLGLTSVTLIYWKARFGDQLRLPLSRGDEGYYFFVFAPAVAYLVLKVIVLAVRFFREVPADGSSFQKIKFIARLNILRMVWIIASAMVATVLGTSIATQLADKFIHPSNSADFDAAGIRLFVCFAVPLFLAVFLLAATIFVGVASKFESDGDREWFARFGAWTLISCVAWIFLTGIALWGLDALLWLYFSIAEVINGTSTWIDKAKTIIVPLVGIASAVLSLGGGFTGKSKAGNEPTGSRFSAFLSVAPRLGAVVFLMFILAGLSGLTQIASGWFLEHIPDIAWLGFRPSTWPVNSTRFLVLYAGILSFFGLLMACLINVNKFSLHGAYRDRLIRAYLGASKLKRQADPFTGFDDMDNFQLHRLKGQRPFHVVNATLNLVDGDKLAWQNRKAASFTMTPLHCGSWALKGYRRTFEYSRNKELGKCASLDACNRPPECGGPCPTVLACKFPGKALRLGTAMAISGAAVNPNMGYYSSPIVMFLMALFNIRLGWWLGNTNPQGGSPDLIGNEYYSKASPTIAVGPLLSETFGRTDEDRRYINVSDGGHFENLGLYEMVMRRSRFIILSDGAADENFDFGDLANAIEQCEVDLGVKIEFDGGIRIPKRGKLEQDPGSKIRFAVGRIRYPERPDGVGREGDGILIYLKPTLFGNEPVELLHYAHAHPSFPHQSTIDQNFDEKQFEAYRELGHFTMRGILEKVDPDNGDLSGFFADIGRAIPPQPTAGSSGRSPGLTRRRRQFRRP
ncbi:MAG: patatin-like phospholipase family protein [Acidobacteriota bacterium]